MPQGTSCKLQVTRLILLCSVFSLSTLYSPLSTAFGYFSGRGEGLARSYSTLASGFDAVLWNPANLAISPKFSFNIATLGVEYCSNLSPQEYMSLYNKEYFNDDDKKMFVDGEKLSISGSAQALSISFKDIALVTYAYTNNKFEIPKDVTDLLFWGNVDLDRKYSLEDIEGKSETGFIVAISGARLLEPEGNIALGGTIKYLHGISYLGVSDSYGSLITTFYSTSRSLIHGQGGLNYKYAQGGYGVGIDFGMTYLSENYNIGISVINAFSTMTWHKGAEQIEVSFQLDSTDLETFDADTTIEWDEKTDEGPFITHSEPIIRIGGTLKGKGILINSELGYPQLFSVGIEYPATVISPRGGIAFVNSRLWVGCGVGLRIIKVLNLDIGMRISSSSHISGAFSLSVIPENQSNSKKK